MAISKIWTALWEGFRIQINDLVNNQLRGLTQGLSDVVGNMTQWAKENPARPIPAGCRR